MHLVVSEYLFYIDISGKNMHKSLVFLLQKLMKSSKSCLPKENLLDYFLFN